MFNLGKNPRRGNQRKAKPLPVGAGAPVPTRAPDGWLLAFVVTLVIIGTLAIYDASYVKAGESKYAGYNPSFYLIQQLKWVGLGTVAFLAGMHMGYWKIRRIAPTALLLVLAALILVLLPGVGTSVGGARRWLDLGPVRVQPSEVAKIVLVFYMAHFLVLNRKRVRDFREGFVPALVPVTLIAALVMLEPDMGTTLAAVGIAMAMLFVGGARLRHLGAFGGAGAALLGLLAYLEPYRLQRLVVYLDPYKDPDGAGYQILHGLSALGSGGLLGLGIGGSRAKWLYLPAEHTDFIFAIIGEEVGFVGGMLILALFLGLARRGFVIADKCKNPFGRLLALGITITITLQALMNIGVVSTIVPATGVPLPLISFGGSSLVLTLFALGVLADISRRPTLPWENNDENDGRAYRRWDRGPHLPGPGDRRGSRTARRSHRVYR